MKSILAVDCGSTMTTAVLIEKIDQEYRVQAAGQATSTCAPPWEDITWGVQESIRHVENVIGRTILSPAGWPITPQHLQQGVDVFLVVSSAAPPLRVVIAGLIHELSLESALRAAATTYTQVGTVISLDADGTSRHSNLETWRKALQEDRPDVILLVGGTDNGAEIPVIEMAQVLTMALHTLPHQDKPTILYAGNAALRPQLADTFGAVTQLISVNNVRPTLETEDINAVRVELEKLSQQKLLNLAGVESLKGWTPHPFIPTSKSFEALVTFISRHNGSNVLGVNVGSRSTVIVSQSAEQASSLIRSDAGVGSSLMSLLKLIPIENFHRWLPFQMSPQALYNQLLNKALYPNVIPTSQEDLIIEQAVTKETIRLMVEQTGAYTFEKSWNLIIAAGSSLTGIPDAAQTALTLIDAVEPWGVVSLALDRSGVVNMLGAIATVAPVAAVNVVNQDAFLNLGTVVAPVGHGNPGQPALTITATLSDDEVIEKEVAYGAIDVISLAPGRKAMVEINPTRHFDVGLGQPGRKAIAEVSGGVLGLIIDARGRPLRLPKDDEQRRALLTQWLTTLNPNYAASETDN